jgi:hypothetical protein
LPTQAKEATHSDGLEVRDQNKHNVEACSELESTCDTTRSCSTTFRFTARPLLIDTLVNHDLIDGVSLLHKPIKKLLHQIRDVIHKQMRKLLQEIRGVKLDLSDNSLTRLRTSKYHSVPTQGNHLLVT